MPQFIFLFPVEDFERARSELAYEELFAIQFAGISRKMDVRKASLDLRNPFRSMPNA